MNKGEEAERLVAVVELYNVWSFYIRPDIGRV